jgi:Zn-finger nucleic acid-binding protein
MLCPIDQSELVISERQGIEIDYCPKCRGVWLDRGELDKIIEGANARTVDRSDYRESDDRQREQSSHRPAKVTDMFRKRDDDDDDDYKIDPKTGRRKKKRGGFLEDLFDF